MTRNNTLPKEFNKLHLYKNLGKVEDYIDLIKNKLGLLHRQILSIIRTYMTLDGTRIVPRSVLNPINFTTEKLVNENLNTRPNSRTIIYT